MGFFEVGGKKLTGAMDEVASSYGPIADGTEVRAVIDKIELTSFNGDEFYQIYWKVTEQGKYINRVVFHKIKCFDQDENKRAKARSMLLRIFKLCRITPPQLQPTEHELNALVGNVLPIQIGYSFYQNKHYNFVTMVFENNQNFKPSYPEQIFASTEPEPTHQQATNAYYGNKQNNNFEAPTKIVDQFNDDIPF